MSSSSLQLLCSSQTEREQKSNNETEFLNNILENLFP